MKMLRRVTTLTNQSTSCVKGLRTELFICSNLYIRTISDINKPFPRDSGELGLMLV